LNRLSWSALGEERLGPAVGQKKPFLVSHFKRGKAVPYVQTNQKRWREWKGFVRG